MLDKRKGDGTLFRDRAFANVYACIYDGEVLSKVLELISKLEKNSF